MEIRVYRYLEKTRMAGPGSRFCLWVQGCGRRCDGCMAVETWPHDGGTLVDIDEMCRLISETPDIEGVTFLGGEPFEQAAVLSVLAYKIKSAGLSIVVFTGFTYEELLKSNDRDVQELLQTTDLLIDGPFIKDKFDLSRPWVGSSNQQYRFLTNRYSENDITNVHNQIEVRISPNGKTLINGMGNFEKIKNLMTEGTE